MRILLMHQTVTNHDAIGNDIEIMYNLIKETGLDCIVYAQNRFNDKLVYISEDDIHEWLEKPDTVILYHHSVYWEQGEELLSKARGIIVFRYHNITPEHFFKDYNDFHYSQCKLGREQTKRYINEYPEALWLADSHYNTTDIEGVDASRIRVCPPFHKIESWSQCSVSDSIIRSLIESDCINLLFVGRVAPNKGHLFLVEILRTFCMNYDNPIKLHIIGKKDDGLTGYNDQIDAAIAEYGLEDRVEFVGEINDSILASYYLGCDFFISASEHEGFCVPVIESQYFGLPVIALNECAVPETGGNGVVLLEKDPRKFAAAIKLLTKNREWYLNLRKLGMENYKERFACESLKSVFMSYIEELKAYH